MSLDHRTKTCKGKGSQHLEFEAEWGTKQWHGHIGKNSVRDKNYMIIINEET